MNFEFDILNGEIIEQPVQCFHNRAFRYGDGIFETIKISNSRSLFIDDHYTRLLKGIQTLKLSHPETLNIESLLAALGTLCTKRNYRNAKARLTVYRDAAGNYTPENNQSIWHLTLSELHTPFYETNEHPYLAGIYRDEKKTKSSLANVKTLNCLTYILAGIAAAESGWDDALITNTDGFLIEVTSSNIFFMKKEQVITPPITDGCLDGVMRKQVISLIASQTEYQLIEKSVREEDLNGFDEIFTTNVISGARNVTELLSRKLKTGFADKINKMLNDAFVNSNN